MSFIRATNAFSNTLKTMLFNSGHVVGSAGAGAISGRFTGTSWQLGLFQGALSGTLETIIASPLKSLIDRNAGKGLDKLTGTSVIMLKTTLFVISVAAEIFITKKYGQTIMNKVGEVIPLLKPEDREAKSYDWMKGLFHEPLPGMVRAAIIFFQHMKNG